MLKKPEDWKVGDWVKLGNRIGQVYEISGNLLLVNKDKGWVWENNICENLTEGVVYYLSEPEYQGTLKPRVDLPCQKSDKPVGWLYTPIFIDGKFDHFEMTKNTKKK